MALTALRRGLCAVILLLAGCCNTGPTAIALPTTIAGTPFLGVGDFQGHREPLAQPVINGLQSTYNGTIVVTMVDRAAVAKMLPTGLRLADPLQPATHHPVIHMIGKQLEPSEVLLGQTIPLPAEGYREMILLVPFVVSPSGARWHNYAVRMYLSHAIPVLGGNALYGYAKELALLCEKEAEDRVSHCVGDNNSAAILFLNDVSLTAPWRTLATPSAAPPRWADLRALLDMPVLGITPVVAGVGGDFVCSYWEWSFTNAEIASASSTHQVISRFNDRMADWEVMGPLANAIDGAMSIRGMRWRLGWPFACQF